MKSKNIKLALITISLVNIFFFTSCKKENKQTQYQMKIPQRIVSLTPAGTEILCAIDAYDQIVARTDFCDYPENIKEKPSTGGFDGKTLSIEKILSFTPDFVYTTKGMHEQLLPLLEQQNIKYYVSTADSVQAVLREILEIGEITGHYEKACNLVKDMEQKLLSFKNKYKEVPSVSVYWEVWNPPYMSVGKTSFINELIEYAGGINIFNEIEQPYPIVSEESILQANPKAIIIPDSEKDGISAILKRSGWKNIEAVKTQRIFVFNTDLISRPGPRIVDAIELIAKGLHE